MQQNQAEAEATVESKASSNQAANKPFVCPVDPAELAQCDSCQ